MNGSDKKIILDLHRQFVLYFKDEIEKPLFKKLMYDLEGLHFWFWEIIFLSSYEEIKSGLNEIERKAFILSYTRQEYLDYHIPFLEPLIPEFFGTLDNKEKAELVFSLFFDSPNSNGLIKYETKFSDFLKFYPLWLDIIRLDENMTEDQKDMIKYDKFIPRNRSLGTTEGAKIRTDFLSIFESINKKDDSLTMEDTLASEDQSGDVNDYNELHNRIKSELTAKEAEVINLLYFDFDEIQTQQIIADKLKISQSAVQQRIKSALIKLKKH